MIIVLCTPSRSISDTLSKSHKTTCQNNIKAGLGVLRIHCGYIPLWRLLHYWLPKYLTTTSLLEPKRHWFSGPLLDKRDEFYWTRSRGGTSAFPAFKVNDSFNLLLLSPTPTLSRIPPRFVLPFDRCRHTEPRGQCVSASKVSFMRRLYCNILLLGKPPLAIPVLCLLPLSELTFSSILQ